MLFEIFQDEDFRNVEEIAGERSEISSQRWDAGPAYLRRMTSSRRGA